MSFALHCLRLGDLFVDVGANVGSYTVLASGVVGAKTIAIEPDAGTAERLARNIAINQIKALVDLRETAVGDRSGHVSFTVGKDTTNQVAKLGGTETQTVPIARLDDILRGQNPTLIKLDVEEHETPVLRGAEETLSKQPLMAILIKTVGSEALEILGRHGFELFGYDVSSRRVLEEFEVLGAFNSLFLRPSADLDLRLKTSPPRPFGKINL